MVAGIEKEEISPPIGRCNEYAGSEAGDGEYIIDLEDYLKTAPGHLTMSLFNVNLWATPADPTSLLHSIEWIHVDWPVETLEHAPSCIAIFS